VTHVCNHHKCCKIVLGNLDNNMQSPYYGDMQNTHFLLNSQFFHQKLEQEINGGMILPNEEKKLKSDHIFDNHMEVHKTCCCIEDKNIR